MRKKRRLKKKRYGKECPSCGDITGLTKHHILPQRHFGKKSKNTGGILEICRNCHNDLEAELREMEGEEKKKLSISEYTAIAVKYGLCVGIVMLIIYFLI